MQVIDRVRSLIRRYALADPETRVVLALSGGSDSVALAHVFRALAATGEVRVAGLVHFNHQLRTAADADERFCVALADGLSWPIVVERDDVGARAARERRSIEDAAHHARHEFFERARKKLDADCVAVGHTRDDQAETFLLRLIRGAGARGLAAMHPRNGRIIRPLLDCRRAELRAFLQAGGIPYVEDETNRDRRVPRNRVRAEILPLLAERFNPEIVDVLAHEAEVARDEWLWMESAAEELWQPGHSEVSVGRLQAAPTALRRVAVWRALNARAGARVVSFEHVEAVMRLLESTNAGGIDLPGQRVERVGDRLVLTSVARGRRTHGTTAFRYQLPVPGEVRVAESGCIVSAESVSIASPRYPAGAVVSNGSEALVRSDSWRGPLSVRNRRPGDRFRPIGLNGRKKLQDFFVDLKVAREERDGIPLVVDENDRIVWVAGYGIDEAFRVTEASQGVVILRMERFAPSGEAVS